MISPLTSAFPTQLIPDFSHLTSLLAGPSGFEISHSFVVTCDGETIKIPGRIYQPALSESQFSALRPMEQAIAACWLTRHHDGYVRERFLRALPAFDSSWVIAYVVALCGEHVVELLHSIWQRRSLFDVAVLGLWLRENPEFYSRTRSRIVSYWDCYYRTARFETFVGSQLLTFFDESIAM